MTCKWVITMVIVSPQDLGLWDPFQTAFSWLINGGDPNSLLNGMILQVEAKPFENSGHVNVFTHSLTHSLTHPPRFGVTFSQNCQGKLI